MMDTLLREANPPTGQLASPKPQYKKPGVDEYEPVEGQHGAPFAILKDASGAVVSPATEATLEQVRALLSRVATENKLEQVRTLLDAISTKDFATSSKQDALKIAVEVLTSELILVKSELDNIKQNQTSGDQKVQLSGTVVDILLEINDRTQTNEVAYIGASIGSAPFPIDISGYKDVGIFINNKGSEMCKLWQVLLYGKPDVRRHQQTPLYTDTNNGGRWIIPAGSSLYLSKRSLERGSLPARGLILTFYDGQTWSTIIDIMVLGER